MRRIALRPEVQCGRRLKRKARTGEDAGQRIVGTATTPYHTNRRRTRVRVVSLPPPSHGQRHARMPAHAPMVKAYATHADTAVRRVHTVTPTTHRHTLPPTGTLPPSDHHAHTHGHAHNPGHTPPTSHTAALARAAERALSMVTPGNATHAGYTTARRIAHACSASTACSLSTPWRRHTSGHAPPSTACSPERTARHGTAWGHPSPPSSGHPSHAPCSPQNVHEACSP